MVDMLRIINRFNRLNISTSLVNNYSTSYDPAMLPIKKSHRKPRWIPIAKSKRFRVPERIKLPEDEAKELLRLNNNYRTTVKSIKRLFVQKYYVLYQKSLDPEEILRLFKNDFVECSQLNDKWNEEVKINREKRLAEQLENEMQQALTKVETELLKSQELSEVVENIVRLEKEASVNFITPENIDIAIDRILAEQVDHNFAITVDGEKIFGRETKPIRDQKEKIEVKQ